VQERFATEQPILGPLPASRFDTSLKVWRKVFKDCTISYNVNQYVVPHKLVGKLVLLRIKDGQLRVFDDDCLIVAYAIPSGKRNFIQDPRFYEALKIAGLPFEKTIDQYDFVFQPQLSKRQVMNANNLYIEI